jgi:hypothetical protein
MTARVLLALSATVLTTTAARAEHYGAPIAAGTVVALDAALAQLADKSAADVVVKSTVARVCEQRGCWLGLKSATGEIHVTFKDEAFFVPPSLIGKSVVAAGRLQKVVTPSRVRYELVASGIDVAQ